MNYKVDIKEINLKESRATAGNGTETFVYEPSVADEEPYGSLSLIGWVENKKNKLEFLPNLIASIIRREFYQPGEEAAGIRFEKALKKANAACADMEKTNKDIAKDVSFCVINIAKDKVRFSVFGDIIVLFWRAGEVIDMRGPRNAWPDKKNLFSTIVSGDILPSDKFIFSTERVMDLFSTAGIQKLCTLTLAGQAEIITQIYQKNSAHTPFPDQAAILFEVKDARYASPLAQLKRIKTAVPQKLKWHTGRFIKLIPSKRMRFFFIILFFLALLGSSAAKIRMKLNALKNISAQLIEAEIRAKEDMRSAAALLLQASGQAREFIPSPLFSRRAQNISREADKILSHLYGMHKETPSVLFSIATRAVTFTPSYLFENGQFIYVFGAADDIYLKAEKKSGETSFAFLDIPGQFHSERMLAKDADFYFINDTEKSAYVFFPEEKTTIKVVKSLAKILATPSAQGIRRDNTVTYALKEKNKIIKKGADGRKETFLLGADFQGIDFAVSQDGTALFLLTKEKVFAFPHQ